MTFIALSLGWGVQSFTMAAMSALGDLPRVDVAIHADTTHERSDTYAFAERWTPWLEEHGVKVVTVSDPEQAAKVTTYKTDAPFFTQKVVEFGGTPIPAYMNTDKGDGKLMRQCTNRWKIVPIRRWLQANRNGQPVESWIGISLDEAVRMKPSDVKYITNRWPLIERRMSRNNCVQWLQAHGLEVPPKSSCVFCPYHDSRAWAELKARGDGDWTKAVAVDEAIRKARPPYDLFVHPARKPLVDVDLRTAEEKGQLRLWDEECEGMCGI